MGIERGNNREPGGYYLDVTFPGSKLGGSGSVEGLLGGDSGWDSDFRLADGIVLDPNTPTSVLDGAFADSWRVTGAASLFDASTVPEPNTLGLLCAALGLSGLAIVRGRRRPQPTGGARLTRAIPTGRA